MTADPGLKRFTDAQERDYETALSEIKNGRKRSHWMWYIFPQVKGLGFSATSQYYGITSLDEAKVFLQHPVLGPRLISICKALLALDTDNATQVFGNPDDLKLRSSMTLFAAVAGSDKVFENVLQKFFDGKPDQQSLAILNR